MPARSTRADLAVQARNEVWKAVCDLIAENGIAPSLREIGERVGYSRANVTRYLDILQARGMIDRLWGVPRSIRVLKPYPGDDKAPGIPKGQRLGGQLP